MFVSSFRIVTHSSHSILSQRSLGTSLFRQSLRSFVSTNSNFQQTNSSTNMTEIQEREYDYDLIVIGGGSGGMACSKAAASLGAKVALFDYVKPSTQGTTWGLGGTCVNVGCVPKKIMHYASLLGQGFHDASNLGWKIQPNGISHDWSELVDSVRNHIRMLNFRYRTGLRKKNVEYINALAKFHSPNTLIFEKDGKTEYLTAKNIVIATGGRPHIPSDIPGAKEFGITSDDIFFLDRNPGKTLCVGGSYIALECAGFLRELGNEVKVAVRSILLRGFDRQCADKIGSYMRDDLDIEFIYNNMPVSITKQSNGKLQVIFEKDPKTGNQHVELFDTVLFATGRQPDLKGLDLLKAGVLINEKTGKLLVNEYEQTNIPHIFGIGDVIEGKQELTPVAIRTGEYLAQRLFNKSTKKMDYDSIATTVFTPIEYGVVGISEEEAIARYGEDDVEVYLSEFTTLEFSATHRLKHSLKRTSSEFDDMGHNCLSKLICIKSQNERVVGFHFIGPNAGEITQVREFLLTSYIIHC